MLSIFNGSILYSIIAIGFVCATVGSALCWVHLVILDLCGCDRVDKDRVLGEYGG